MDSSMHNMSGMSPTAAASTCGSSGGGRGGDDMTQLSSCTAESALFSVESRRTAMKHVLEAMVALDRVRNEAFFTAHRKCPHLIQSETNPIHFLRATRFNVPNAAALMCAYWSARLATFGPERAFFPMEDLSGTGCLSKDEVATYMQRMPACTLPKHWTGRSVVWLNGTSSSPTSSDQSVRLKCLFFALHQAAQNKSSAEDGVILLAVASKDTAAWKLCTSAFPLSFCLVHVFWEPSGSNDESSSLAQYQSSLLKSIGGELFQKTRIHTLSTPERLTALMRWRFAGPDVPPQLGGTFGPTALRESIQGLLVAPAAGVIAPNGFESEELQFFSTIHHQQRQMLQQDSAYQMEMQIMQQRRHHQQRPPPQLALNRPDARAAGVVTSPHDYDFGMAPSFSGGERGHHHQLCPSGGDRQLPATTTENMKSSLTNTNNQEDEYNKRTGLGLPNLPEETDEALESSRREVQQAIDSMPMTKKQAYLEALDKAPHLVHVESDALRFLRCTNFSAPATADRLVSYWTMRKRLFVDRFLFPMAQTGEGALTNDDVVVLSSGSVAILPNDDKGRHVFITDRNRALQSVTAESKLRCFFYLMCVVSERQVSQKDGLVVVEVLVTPRVNGFSKSFSEQCLAIQQTVPVRIKGFHLLVLPPKSGKKADVDQIVDVAVKMAKEYYGSRTILHQVHSAQQLLTELQKFGLSKENVPRSAGGTWKYEEFSRWQRRRIKFEQSYRKPASSPTEDDVAGEGPTGSVAEKGESDDNSEAKKERKRKLNIIHSRQKRERRREEMRKLQEECDALQEHNTRLKRDHNMLQTAHNTATAMVNQIEQRNAFESVYGMGAGIGGMVGIMGAAPRGGLGMSGAGSYGGGTFGGFTSPSHYMADTMAMQGGGLSFHAGLQQQQQQLVQMQRLNDEQAMQREEQAKRRDVMSGDYASVTPLQQLQQANMTRRGSLGQGSPALYGSDRMGAIMLQQEPPNNGR